MAENFTFGKVLDQREIVGVLTWLVKCRGTTERERHSERADFWSGWSRGLQHVADQLREIEPNQMDDALF